MRSASFDAEAVNSSVLGTMVDIDRELREHGRTFVRFI
jgi:hypothetical protein